MTESRAHPRWGWDFDWLGVDADGHVAVFSSGYGAVPLEVNLHVDDVDAARYQIDTFPLLGVARDLVRESPRGDYSRTSALSARGFFNYDWKGYHGPYVRLSAPSVPLAVTALPAHIQRVARLAIFHVRFADTPEFALDYVEPPFDH